MRPHHEVAVVIGEGANSVTLVGHGLIIPERFKLAPGIYVQPRAPSVSAEIVANGCATGHEMFAILSMQDIASFSIHVGLKGGGHALATKAWNALWDFHLLSVASGAPAFSLFAMSEGTHTEFAVANRNLIVNPVSKLKVVTVQQLVWARKNRRRFVSLIQVPQFSLAMRYFANSHYLHDLDARVMLLWAGIEALFDVDLEQSRRIALYSALMMDGDAATKAAHFEAVKRAYGIRSRVVHGKKLKRDVLAAAYEAASVILSGLLAKTVSLGRVPTRAELDAISASGRIK